MGNLQGTPRGCGGGGDIRQKNTIIGDKHDLHKREFHTKESTNGYWM